LSQRKNLLLTLLVSFQLVVDQLNGYTPASAILTPQVTFDYTKAVKWYATNTLGLHSYCRALCSYCQSESFNNSGDYNGSTPLFRELPFFTFQIYMISLLFWVMKLLVHLAFWFWSNEKILFFHIFSRRNSWELAHFIINLFRYLYIPLGRKSWWYKKWK
jgi:hypothetical protein